MLKSRSVIGVFLSKDSMYLSNAAWLMNLVESNVTEEEAAVVVQAFLGAIYE